MNNNTSKLKLKLKKDIQPAEGAKRIYSMAKTQQMTICIVVV